MKEQENSKPIESNLVISEIISVRKKSEKNLISKENNKEKSKPFYDSLNSFVDSHFDKKLKGKEPKSYMDDYYYVYPYEHLEISGNFGEDKDIKFEVIKFNNSTIINFEDLDYRITVSNQKIEKVSKEYKKIDFNRHTTYGGPPMPVCPSWTELAKPEEIQGYMDIFKKLEEKTDVEYRSTWCMAQLQ